MNGSPVLPRRATARREVSAGRVLLGQGQLGTVGIGLRHPHRPHPDPRLETIDGMNAPSPPVDPVVSLVAMTEWQTISHALLVWLSRQAHQPDPLEFLATPDGATIMPTDLEQLIVRLDGFGPVRCRGWRSASGLPQRVALPQRGRGRIQAVAADTTTAPLWQAQVAPPISPTGGTAR